MLMYDTGLVDAERSEDMVHATSINIEVSIRIAFITWWVISRKVGRLMTAIPTQALL